MMIILYDFAISETKRLIMKIISKWIENINLTHNIT